MPIKLDALDKRDKELGIWRSLILSGLLLFIVLIVISYFVLNSHNHNLAKSHVYLVKEQILGFGELLGIIISSFSLMHFMSLRNKYDKSTFEEFVKDNSWNLTKKTNLDDIASILVNAGDNYEVAYAFTGKFAENKFSCMVFRFLKSVKDRSKTESYICMHFSLPKSYPMIVIMNRQGKLHNRGGLKTYFKDEVAVNLEGDFSKYYLAKTTKGNEQELLEVLSPEFMSELEDEHSLKVDIEINDKDAYFIYKADFYSKQNIKSILSVANVTLSKLSKLSKTWMTGSSFEEETISKNALAVRYKQLSTAQLVIYLVTIVILFAFVIYILATNNQANLPYQGYQ